MISLNRLITGMILLLVLVSSLFLTGCIKAKNPTGNNWSDVYPLSYSDSTSFIAGYSFAGSGTVKGTETSLLSGNYNDLESIAIMRFTSMPEGFYIPGGYQDSTYLELTLVKRSPFTRYPVDLTVYKLNQSWAADSTNLIQDGNMSIVTPLAFTIPDTIKTAGTVVKIPIPIEEIHDWESEADTLGFTLVVKTGEDSYVEMLSVETGRGPRLRFKYRNDTDVATDDDSEYLLRATRDSYRLDADASPLLTDRWLISNVSPSRIYVNFAMDYSKFLDTAGNILDETARKRATINKAELVFYVKDNPYYSDSAPYSLRGDRVRDSLNIAVPVELTDTQVASGLTSTAVIHADSVVVNVTPLIQAYSSGDSKNWGVVIRSTQELLNFGKLELWHFTDAPAGKKPRLQVTYTPPYL